MCTAGVDHFTRVSSATFPMTAALLGTAGEFHFICSRCICVRRVWCGFGWWDWAVTAVRRRLRQSWVQWRRLVVAQLARPTRSRPLTETLPPADQRPSAHWCWGSTPVSAQSRDYEMTSQSTWRSTHSTSLHHVNNTHTVFHSIPKKQLPARQTCQKGYIFYFTFRSFFLFLNLSKAISGSTRPIFTICALNGRY